MATSPRMGWPYPQENQDPFWDAFVAFVAAQDASVFALKEDRDLFMMKGGNVSFVLSSGLISWTAAIEMNSAGTGFKWSIPAGSATLNDGDYLYVTLPHNPTTNLNVVVGVGQKLPPADIDNPIILALRNGDRVYFRDGRIILDGQTLALFSTMNGGGGGGGVGAPGEKWRSNVTMVVADQNNTVTPKVMGGLPLAASDYVLTGTTLQFTFAAQASVDVGTVTGTVVLYDLTGTAVVATLTFAGNTTPAKQSTVVSLASPEHIYEVRGQLTVGAGTLYVTWAGIQIDNTVI